MSDHVIGELPYSVFMRRRNAHGWNPPRGNLERCLLLVSFLLVEKELLERASVVKMVCTILLLKPCFTM